MTLMSKVVLRLQVKGQCVWEDKKKEYFGGQQRLTGEGEVLWDWRGEWLQECGGEGEGKEDSGQADSWPALPVCHDGCPSSTSSPSLFQSGDSAPSSCPHPPVSSGVVGVWQAGVGVRGVWDWRIEAWSHTAGLQTWVLIKQRKLDTCSANSTELHLTTKERHISLKIKAVPWLVNPVSGKGRCPGHWWLEVVPAPHVEVLKWVTKRVSQDKSGLCSHEWDPAGTLAQR